MSDMEGHVGKLWEVAKDSVGFEAKCKEVGIWDNLEDYCKEDEYIDDYELDRKYIYSKKLDKLFEYTSKSFDYDDCLYGNFNNKNELEFITVFYNGGTCLTEQLGELINQNFK